MGGQTVILAADVRAPSGSTEPTKRMALAGTGATEDQNNTALTVGQMATLMGGPVAISVVFEAAKGSGSSVATTDLYLVAGGRIDWMVQATDAWVSVAAFDESSAYQASVWTSSGPRVPA
jgi:hypothetical protein